MSTSTVEYAPSVRMAQLARLYRILDKHLRHRGLCKPLGALRLQHGRWHVEVNVSQTPEPRFHEYEVASLLREAP